MNAVVFSVGGITKQERTQATYKLEHVIRPRGGRDPVYVGSGVPAGFESAGLRPRFTLYADLEGRQPLCVVGRLATGQSAGDRRVEVLDPHGTALGAVRLPAKRERWRPRHEIELPGGGRLSGRAGTGVSWMVFVLLSPLWLVVNLAVALHDGTIDLYWSLPRRTAWRRSRGPVPGLSAMKFYGLTDRYKVRTNRLDIRIAYAQAVLHRQASL